MKGRRILGIGLAVMVVVGVAVAAVGEWPSGAGLELVGDEALVAGGCSGTGTRNRASAW